MRRKPSPLFQIAVGLVLASPVAATSLARAAESANNGVAATPPLAIHQILGLEAGIALRVSRIGSTGFDAFSDNDALVESTLSVSYWFIRMQALDVAGGVEWSHGAATSQLRGTASSLDLDGLAVTLKASVPLASRLAAFARLAPGAVHLDASLRDASAVPVAGSGVASMLTQTKWLPSLDVAAGAALRLASFSTGPQALAFQCWLLAEGGYGYSPSYGLTLGGPNTTTAGRSDQPIRLGSLSMRGGFMRFGVAMSF
jgi:hypothetical protein